MFVCDKNRGHNVMAHINTLLISTYQILNVSIYFDIKNPNAFIK